MIDYSSVARCCRLYNVEREDFFFFGALQSLASLFGTAFRNEGITESDCFQRTQTRFHLEDRLGLHHASMCVCGFSSKELALQLFRCSMTCKSLFNELHC